MPKEILKPPIWKFGECVPKKVRGKTTDEFNIYRAKFENHIGRRLKEEEIM